MAEKRKLAHVPGLKIMPGTIRTVGNTIHVPKPWKTLANKQKRKLKKRKEKKNRLHNEIFSSISPSSFHHLLRMRRWYHPNPIRFWRKKYTTHSNCHVLFIWKCWIRADINFKIWIWVRTFAQFSSVYDPKIRYCCVTLEFSSWIKQMGRQRINKEKEGEEDPWKIALFHWWKMVKESRENFEFWVGFCFVLYMYKKEKILR